MKKITILSRQNRKNSTPAETKFWSYVRNQQWEGLKWHRQKPIIYEEIMDKKNFFIADFYCPSFKLVVELDGAIHDQQQEYDAARTAILESLGYHVVRFSNEEVMNGVVWENLKQLIASLEQKKA